MDLSPLASALNAVLTGLPFAVAEELDPSAVHLQVQWVVDAPIGDLDGERLLSHAQGRVIRHGLVQVGHLHQTGDQPRRSPER